MLRLIEKVKQMFCKHDPYRFRALNEPEVLVCKKCGANYIEKAL